MRPKSLLLLALALGCGLVASIGIEQYLSARPEAPEQAEEGAVLVLVAAGDIPQGMIVQENQVKLEQWPEDRVPRGAITDPATAIGRSVKQKVYAGEPLLELKLAEPGARGAAGLIPDGMRAFTVKVDAQSGVAGFVAPGDRVDVVLTLSRNNLVGEPLAKTILENVLVWAVDQNMNKDVDDPDAVPAQVVTLLVEPQQVNTLALASNQGTLRLTLRNNVDGSSIPTANVTLRQLIDTATGKGPQKEERQPAAESAGQGLMDLLESMGTTASAAGATGSDRFHIMEIIRGQEVEEKQFPLED